MTAPTTNVLKFQRPKRKNAPEGSASSAENPITHAPIQSPITTASTNESPAKAAFKAGLKSGLQDGMKVVSKSFSTPIARPFATSKVNFGKAKAFIPTNGLRVTWKPQPEAVKATRFSNILGIVKTIGRKIFNVILLMLLVIGTGTVWDATVGDGALPQLNNLKQTAPAQAKLAQLNSTANLPLEEAQRNYWTYLSASRNLLLSLSPQIAFWLLELHQKGHIVPHTPNDIHQTYHVSEETPMLAAYRYNEDTLYLGEEFWKLSDGQKVAVISHEYRHSRQNAGKRLSYQLAQWIGLGQLNHQTPMENEAMDYERQAQTAMGIN